MFNVPHYASALRFNVGYYVTLSDGYLPSEAYFDTELQWYRFTEEWRSKSVKLVCNLINIEVIVRNGELTEWFSFEDFYNIYTPIKTFVISRSI